MILDLRETFIALCRNAQIGFVLNARTADEIVDEAVGGFPPALPTLVCASVPML